MAVQSETALDIWFQVVKLETSKEIILQIFTKKAVKNNFDRFFSEI